MAEPRSPIAADTGVALLCGGAGSRLGGVDKPLALLAGRPLIEHVIDSLPDALRAAPRLIVANRNAGQYARYGRVIDDGRHRGRGPLAGIAAALAAGTTEQLLCLPGDAPALPANLFERLDRARTAGHAALAVAHDGHGLQPLCLLLPRSLLGELERFLDGGGRAAQAWVREQAAATADCRDVPRWAWSLNTIDEWTAAEQRLHKGALT